MNISLILKCFLIGVIAASGCGPVFILTFNKGAICGFFKGLATGIGSSLGDSFYFFLGLVGTLTVISEFGNVMTWFNVVGAIVLVGIGVHSIKKARDVDCVTVGCSENFFLSIGKGLFLTIFNPLIIFFFIALSVQVLPHGLRKLPLNDVISYSFAVMLGSLAVLATVSLVASLIGGSISSRKLKIISGVTGIGFILFGAYLFINVVSKYINIPIPKFF